MLVEFDAIAEYMGTLYAAARYDLETANPTEVTMRGCSVVEWRRAYLEGIKDVAEGIITRVPDGQREEAKARGAICLWLHLGKICSLVVGLWPQKMQYSVADTIRKCPSGSRLAALPARKKNRSLSGRHFRLRNYALAKPSRKI